MVRRDLEDEWSRLSGPWIEEARRGRNPTREGLLDGPMLAACGDVTGSRIIDLGCGEGRFCRLLVGRGAELVLGVDLCGEMIEAARELKTGPDQYVLADAQDLGFLEDGTFDLAVSYLNQCDLPDHRANNSEVFRVLGPGGRFVVANLHPMRSAVGQWHRDDSGDKVHVVLDRYFEEGERRWRMMGVDFTNFHRTLSSYVNDFLKTGFLLTGIMEPTVTKKDLERYPELEDEVRVPNFIVYILKKPAP